MKVLSVFIKGFFCFAFLLLSESKVFPDIWGQIGKAAADVDPSTNNNAWSRATGYKVDPSVVLPHPRPPQPSTFGDPEVIPVEYRIDPRTGLVYEHARGHQEHATGERAHVKIINGRRAWVAHGRQEWIPNDVDERGDTHVSRGTMILLENQTSQQLTFRCNFVASDDPNRWLTFKDFHTLAPGQKNVWVVTPEHTVSSNAVGNARQYRIVFTVTDSVRGAPMPPWPATNVPGLSADVDRTIETKENGRVFYHKLLQFVLR